MKKIINGKTYNTNTATIIGGWDNGYNVNDFDYCAETLYKNRHGYFLVGESGARGPYAVETGNGWSRGGEEILPMEKSEARVWAKETIEADDFAREFGTVQKM
jgi:hypothetical protein